MNGFALGQAVPALAIPHPVNHQLPVVQKPRPSLLVRPRERRNASSTLLARLAQSLARPGASLLMALLVVGGAGAYGSVRGGQYGAFVAANGTFADVLARAIGFKISAVVISADNGMSDQEILKVSGVDANSSLLFLDAAGVRAKLMAVPLVKEASVRKLFPDRLLIDVEERQPYGLWQKDGQVAVIAADGTAIDTMRDDRFASLPFVVGEGANLRIAEFSSLLEAAGELRPKIRAGVLVSGRRWNLKMSNGVDVKLPETGAAKAIAALAVLDHDARVIDKDVLFLDFRQPGRMMVRLGAEAAAARAEMTATKKNKGGQI